MTGQISLIDYIHDRDGVTFGGCGKCVCRSCLYWWSGRCPYGGCYDKHRAEIDPYDKAHPGSRHTGAEAGYVIRHITARVLQNIKVAR